jgi:hypothetical protein
MANKVFVGDVGTDIILRTGEDLTDINSIEFVIDKPDGTQILRIGYVYGSVADGKVHYVTQATDIDILGKYEVQAECTFINPSRHFSTEIVELQAYRKLKA